MDPSKSEGEPEKPAIPTAIANTPTAGSQHPPPSPLSGCYLLVVLPEPHNAQHKDLILNRIAKGFLSWDKDNCHVDLEKELQALVAQAPEGEEARNGERLIQYATENLVTEILIHPQSNTLLQCIRNLLASFTKHRHIIHAGYTFNENGSWILQDGTFSLADFLDAFNEHDVQRVLRAYENSVTVDINCAAIGEWSMQRLSKEPCTRSCRVRLNPDDVLTAGVPVIASFTNYISQYLVPQALDQLMQPSDVVGNIRFSHPTLYVFPGGQGDAALFGINGFNMLVDGGFARKSCFWDFTRHLDRLDAVLLTRMNNSNMGGMSSVLRKKRESQVYPQIGHFFCNLVERKHSNSPDGDKDIDPLILSLTELGQEMMLNLKHINLRPHPCYRDTEPINLYHKVGHGTLDMYVLSPSKDSREVREFLSKWNAGDWKLFAGSHKKDSNNLTFPIQNLVSICALLVWQPANPEDTITRILFPGSTPQHKIFEGIERLRHLEFLKHPRCTAKSISSSASLVPLKDKTMKIQKMSLMDRETKRAMEVRKAKREDETKSKIELTQPEKVEEKPKAIPKKREIVENKKIDSDIKENGVKDAKKIDKELNVKETKKVVKDDVKKTEMIKIKPETEKTASVKETKPKPERKEKKIAKESVQKISLPKTKLDGVIEKKIKAAMPKKIVNGVSPKPEDKGKTAATKPGPKAATKALPVAAPKSAKDANNRKVVEQKNIERMSMSKAPAKPKPPPAAPVEKKPVPRRPKPTGSPSKAKFIAGSPIKSAKSTPTASVKSDKDGVIRKIKTEKGTADSSTVSTPSAIEIDSMNKFTDKCLTEKSEDMSLDSIESKVLADLKEERQVVEEIEAVLQKAERIEVARKESRIEVEDEVTGEATDKKDITEDMTEDDVTADIDEVPRKTPTRKASQEQLTEEEDEYLIIEKEEGDTEDSVHSGEAEHKHFLDAVQSEKEKILKDGEEYDEKEVADLEELEPEELEEGDEDELEKEEDESEEKEVAEEKGIMEEREKSDDASEKKPHAEIQKTPEKDNIPLAEYKEQLEEEMKGIITSATEIVQKTEEKDDSGKKDSEDITKEPSSPSPEKLDFSEKKTTDTDIKPEAEKTKEKMEESQERISTIESGATTTAPTLPEDERISIDVVKPPTTEKTIEDKKIEVPQKPIEIMSLATEPSEVKPEVRMINVRQGPQALQRDIVKTPDEVADLPVHEEVDPKLYKMDDFDKSKDEKSQVTTTAPQNIKESPNKEQKGVFSFFGKVADKFEKGMDKLTGKSRRDSEKDIDEKSSSKSASPKDEIRADIAPIVVSDIQPAKTEEKDKNILPPSKSPQSEEKIEQIPLDGPQKSTDGLDDLEDADGVEALLEEASKKFKTVKDSLRDSLESLEEKIVEEEFKRAVELASSTKDEVKDTLEEVVEKLEGIKPEIDGIALHEKGPEKVHFVVPADEDDDGDDESTDLVRDMKEAVREVGEVLAGTAGIILEEKPKDVIEIVKKVAEVLKEDDFLSDKVLFEMSTESPAAKTEIEESVEKKTPPLLEFKEEPCIKKIIEEQPVISPSTEKTLDEADAKAICEDLMNEVASGDRRKRSITEHEGPDVLEAGIERVCQKVELPERQEKEDSPEVDHKEDRRDSMEIEPSQIALEHKIAPTTAEYVIVTPDSLPPSPKFPNEKLQSHIEKEMITSKLPMPRLPVEIENIIESAKTIDEIIEQLVFMKNQKITIEIIEYMILIKRVPREQIIHIIQEIVIKKKVPQESIVEDTNILKSEEKTPADNVELAEKETDVDTKGEFPKEEDDSIITDGKRAEVESEILDEYVTKSKKITQAIIEEIHVKRQLPIYVIINIIEYIIVKKKLQKQSIMDINDETWEELKLNYTGEEEEEEGKSVEEDFIIIPSAEEIENIHLAESEILNNYIDQRKKITREIIEEIHITRKIPIYVVIEIIEKIIITKKLRKHSTIDIPESIWNDLKSEALKEEKRISEKAHDGFEAVEQEYKFSEQKEQKIEVGGGIREREEALDDDTSDVIEADEKLIDKTFIDKSRGSVTLDEKTITEPEEKDSPKDRKLSAAEIQKEKEETSQLLLTEKISMLEPDKDAESATVRRMIVTTTSEDGGDEIVICPAGSITFGKSTPPEDTLKSSPVKTQPDKDSLHSHESTPKNDSISTKDSLDKSKTDEKKIHETPAHTIEDKAITDLHLDEIYKQPLDFGKTEDVSPAESVFAESPLKQSSKSDVVDAKPIPDEKTQNSKGEVKVVPSVGQVADLNKDTSTKETTSSKPPIVRVEQKESIDVVLDKSRSSSIGSLTQDQTVPAPMDIPSKDSTVSKEIIVKADGENIPPDEISEAPIITPSSDDVDLTIRKESVTQGLPDQPSRPENLKLHEQIDDELKTVQTKITGIEEKEELEQNLDKEDAGKTNASDKTGMNSPAVSCDETLDLKIEGRTSETQSPSPGPDAKQSVTSPDIATIEKDSRTLEDTVGKGEKSGSIVATSPISKVSPVPQGGEKLKETQDELHEKEGIYSPTLPNVSSSRKESLVQEKELLGEKSIEIIGKTLMTGVDASKTEQSPPVISPLRRESITLEQDDQKISEIADSSKSSTSLTDISPITTESLSGKKDLLSDPVVSTPQIPADKGMDYQNQHGGVINEKILTTTKEYAPLDSKEHSTDEIDIKYEEIKAGAQSDQKKSQTPSPTDVKSSKSSRETSPMRKESFVIESKDIKANVTADDRMSSASSIGDAKSTKSSRETSPVRKESLIVESDVKTQVGDKKSPTPSVTDVKSPLSSRDISPLRKESLLIESQAVRADVTADDRKSPVSSVGDAKSMRSSRDTSPVRKESLIVESDVKTQVGDKKSPTPSVTDVKSPLSSRGISPLRKESLLIESQAVRADVTADDRKSPVSSVGDDKSMRSSRDTSPVRKESLIIESDVKTEVGDKKSPTPSVTDAKSPLSLRDISPLRKESLLIECKDVRADVTADDRKSPVSSVGDDKSMRSSRDTSPVRKESLIIESDVKTEVGDKKSPTPSVTDAKSPLSLRDISPLRKESLLIESKDVRADVTADDRKSPVSSVGDVKSMRSSRDTSPVRKESLIVESDITPGAGDKKSPILSATDAKLSLSSHDISPLRKESLLIESKAVRADDTADDRKSPASGVGDAKSTKSSRDTSPVRKESLIIESDVKTEVGDKKSPTLSVTDAKSPLSSRDISPLRKESLLIESKDVRADVTADDRKSPVSSVGDVKSMRSSRDTSPVRKESLIVESDVKTEVGDKKSPTPSVTDAKSPLSTRDVSPLRKERLLIESKDVRADVTADDRKSPVSSVGDVKSMRSSRDPSPVRKESLIVESDVKTEVGDTKSPTPSITDAKSPLSPRDISPLKTESILIESKDVRADVTADDRKSPTSSVGDAKSIKSSRDTSPVRNESLIVESDVKTEVGDTKSPTPSITNAKSPLSPRDISPLRKESILSEAKVLKAGVTADDTKSPTSSVGDAKSMKSSRDTSPIRKESLIVESGVKAEVGDTKSPTPSITDTKSPLSSRDISPLREESLLSESKDVKACDTKSLASSVGDGKSMKSSRDTSPVRKDSLIVESDITPGAGDKKSPILSATDAKLSLSSHDISPLRKESLLIESKAVRADDTADDRKSPASSVGDAKSTKSSRDTSPVRKESLIIESDVQPAVGDKKSSTPSITDAKSPLSSRDISPLRKESLKVGKLEEQSVEEGDKISPSAVSASPIRKESISYDDKEKSPELAGKTDEKIAPSPVSAISPIRKESLIDEKSLPSTPPKESISDEHGEKIINSEKPLKSPGAVSPIRKQSITFHETSETGKSGDERDEAGIGRGSPSPAKSLKSPASPRDTSPVRKECIALEEKVPVSPRLSIDIKYEEKIEDGKAPSPLAAGIKSSTSPGDTSQIKRESLVSDEKLPSDLERESVDLKSGELGIDRQTPSPVAESHLKTLHEESPQDTSLIKKENLFLEEKILTPRISIDMKGNEDNMKNRSPIDIASTGDTNLVSDEKIAIGKSPRPSVDLKPGDLVVGPDNKSSSSVLGDVKSSMSPRETSPIREENIAISEVVSASPRTSIAIRHDETLLDNKSPSPDSIESSLRDTSPVEETHSLIIERALPTSTATIDSKPDENCEKASSPDEKVSIDDTTRASIVLKLEERTTDKETPSDKKTSSPDEKVSTSDTPRASVDIKLEEKTTDKKTSSPDDKVSMSGTPRASIDVNLGEGTSDEKAPSPAASVSPIILSPVRKRSTSEKFDDKNEERKIDDKSPDSAETNKESIIGEEKQVVETSISAQLPDDSLDAKIHAKELPSPSVVDPKSTTSSPDISPVMKESLAQVLQQAEEKRIDVKSSASSRDSSPIRKDSLIPELREKSLEPSSLASHALQKSKEKVDVKSSESDQVVLPARKESPTADVTETFTESSAFTQAAQNLGDKKLGDKSPTSLQEPSPARKESVAQEAEEKCLESSELISEKPKDEEVCSKSPSSQGTTVQEASVVHTIREKSPEPLSPPIQPKHDDSIPKDTIEKDLGIRSRSSSMASEKSTIQPTKDGKSITTDTLHQLELSLHDDKSKIPSPKDSSPQKLTTPVAKPDNVEFSEVPSRDRSRSHSLFDTGEKTPVGRSRAASLFEDKEDIVKSVSQKSSGLSEFHEDHFQREETNDDLDVSEAKRIDIERYIMSQYVTRNRKITGSTLEEIVALYDVPNYIVIETIYEICKKMKISRESIIENLSIIEETSKESSAIKEGDDGGLHQFETYKGTVISVTQNKEEHMSGKSSPERRSSGYSTPEVRHYDDKYESQFHKAFVGGMTEIRTTHITTLSGKSTPDVGTRIDTPDSLTDTATSSDKMGQENIEADPTVIKRTITTEIPEYETIVKKTVIKREIIEDDDDDDDGITDGKSTITTRFDDKGVMKVDLSKSLMSSSSGRSTPDRIRDSSEGRSSTATPDSLRSHEVIKTTITKTRTMSDEGEIITTTKEVTETTNERGETTVVEEKIDVKTTQAESGMEISAHQWPEQRHREDSEEDSPLSATSQVYHYEKDDQKHVEFSTADMSSSFYGKLPDIPQPRHSTEPMEDDKDFSFKKFSLEKRFGEEADKQMTTSRQLADIADFDVAKVLRPHEHDGDDEDEDKDPIVGWGTPLKLPSPERPDKFNLRSTPIVRSSLDMSPDSLNFDVINDWGEPLRLPSPAPTADEASNKTMPPTPKKERRQPKKIVAENMKNKMRSDSPASKEKKKDSKKVQPVYLDLTYVPHHGNSYYASLDFFKRVRARYYVFSGTEPSREVYDALLDAKKTWENKNLEVTMIPTYDTDTLGYWVADNEEALAANHIDLSPSASRCTINLQDHETSCSAYRLEF